jgi:hypothetical protein
VHVVFDLSTIARLKVKTEKGSITAEEREHAEFTIIRPVQRTKFSKEISANFLLCTARMIAVSACSLSSTVIDPFFLSSLLALQLWTKQKQRALTVTKRLYFEILSKNLISISGSNCDTKTTFRFSSCVLKSGFSVGLADLSFDNQDGLYHQSDNSFSEPGLMPLDVQSAGLSFVFT